MQRKSVLAQKYQSICNCRWLVYSLFDRFLYYLQTKNKSVPCFQLLNHYKLSKHFRNVLNKGKAITNSISIFDKLVKPATEYVKDQIKQLINFRLVMNTKVLYINLLPFLQTVASFDCFFFANKNLKSFKFSNKIKINQSASYW